MAGGKIVELDILSVEEGMYSDDVNEIEVFVRANFTEEEYALAFAIFRHEMSLSDGFGYYGNPIKAVKLIIADFRNLSTIASA